MLQVYVLLPLFMKFGGAVCICLRRWLDSSDVPDGETFDPLQSSHDMPQAPIPNNDICGIRDKQVSVYEGRLSLKYRNLDGS